VKAHLTLLALVLWAAALAVAQTSAGSSGGQLSTAPNAQTAPSNSSDASANPPGSTNQNDSSLQSQIANALRDEPALSNSHIVVNISGESIDLSGTVGSSKDKQTAERIAQSFDGNRKLNDSLTITGQKPGNGQAGSATNNPPAAPPQR
jgi:hyperosmotically inducible periplasmic protein